MILNPTPSFQLQFRSHSPEETRDLAEKIGSVAFDGFVIALTGDLGSGKTAFVQGLAIGLEVLPDYVITSPTYTLINEYPARLHLYHVDLYRIENKVDFDEIGLYEVLHGQGVCAVEWAERIAEDLPDQHLAVHLSILDDQLRQMTLTAFGPETVDRLKQIAKGIEETE